MTDETRNTRPAYVLYMVDKHFMSLLPKKDMSYEKV